jgi:hypothetical protein
MSNQTYVAIRTERRLFTVGFYKPDGDFETDSDFADTPDEREQMRARINYLNGGAPEPTAQHRKDFETEIERLTALAAQFDDATFKDIQKLIRAMRDSECALTEKIMYLSGSYQTLLTFLNQ